MLTSWDKYKKSKATTFLQYRNSVAISMTLLIPSISEDIRSYRRTLSELPPTVPRTPHSPPVLRYNPFDLTISAFAKS